LIFLVFGEANICYALICNIVDGGGTVVACCGVAALFEYEGGRCG
jgi:hypothetical protein